MDCNSADILCQVMGTSSGLISSLPSGLFTLLGIFLAFTLLGSIVSALNGAVHSLDEPVAPTPPPIPAPPPTAARQPKRLIEMEDILTWVEVIRELRRPANCSQCGAPREPNQTKCSHCGRSL